MATLFLIIFADTQDFMKLLQQSNSTVLVCSDPNAMAGEPGVGTMLSLEVHGRTVFPVAL